MATAVIRALYLIALMSPAVGRINRGLAVLASKGRFCRGLLPARALGFQSIPISGLRLPPTTIFPQTIEQRRMVTSATARITDDIKTAAKELREDGRLVAFPTETVYGLGANAYNETAVRYVFQVKGRPLTDPLIVHVPTPDGAWAVYRCAPGSLEREVLSHLATRFWPGPLTLVAPAAEDIPSAVTAETGWVGVRCPQLRLARDFLQEARVPVVAPSANRFGHVSPTTAEHVFDDLGGHDIIILKADGGAAGQEEQCEVGIESTVAKVDVANKQITILRSGAITPSDLRQSLDANPAFRGFTVQARGRAAPVAVEEGPQVSPGLSLKHYAPDAPTYLVIPTSEPEPWLVSLASDAVVLDIEGRLGWLQPHCRAYRDLAAGKGGIREVARSLFDALRWAEVEANRSKTGTVLLCDLRHGPSFDQADEEFATAVADRMVRAASGKVAQRDGEQ